MRLVSYRDQDNPIAGIVEEDESTVRPLRLPDGLVRDLVPLIENWSTLSPSLTTGEPKSLAELDLLPPVRTARNVFCVGKNYRTHAVEFARSGFDASTTEDLPTHPTVFTKASTSLTGGGHAILAHQDLTNALDYEGELAVIIGRGGRAIPATAAWDHVWGYTLLNDVTARDRQRDHKQWFMGKSLDTFAPMGPFAVTAEEIDLSTLRISTLVNGETRQDGLLADLIFDVPALIATLSAGITLQPGDVIATGTPAGVGIGFTPPRYLRPGDTVTISAPRLGSLTNRVERSTPPARQPAESPTGLRRVRGKDLFVEVDGEGPAVVLIHGLGGTTSFYQPQAAALAEDHMVIRFDFSGHGRSPVATTPSVESWANDLEALLDQLGVDSAAVVGHSLGTLIAAHFAATRPERVDKLVLLGAVRAQPPQAKEATRARASTVREKGMRAVADAVVTAATSETTRTTQPALAAFVRELLLGQRAEGYARACEALANATTPSYQDITAGVLLLTGSDDVVGPPATSEEIAGELGSAEVCVLPDVGHWHCVEAAAAVTGKLREFLTKP